MKFEVWAARGHRGPTIPLLTVWVLAAAVSVDATIILKKKGRSAVLAQALAAEIGSQARIVELSGDALADSALVARESDGSSVLFTIGPAATEIAGEQKGPGIVSVGVPNPARVRAAGAYISMYPRLDRVFDYIKTKLNGRRAGLLFSPSENRDVAVAFLRAGQASGVAVQAITVSSRGELARKLRGQLAKVDVLLLAIDPVVLTERNLSFIVKETKRAKKVTVGFLEGLLRVGVTVSIIAPLEAMAAAAVAASSAPVRVGKKRVDVETAVVMVSRESAQTLGLNPEAMGAEIVR